MSINKNIIPSETFSVPPEMYKQWEEEDEAQKKELEELKKSGKLDFDYWDPEDDYNDELDYIPYEKPVCKVDLNNLEEFECDSSTFDDPLNLESEKV